MENVYSAKLDKGKYEKINLSERKDINIKELDLNDSKVLDSIELNKADYIKGLITSILFTTIAILIFFIPFTINGKPGQVLFGVIYNTIINVLGNFGLWMVTLVLVANGLTSVYGKYISKKGTKLYNYYEKDSIIHPILYVIGGIFAVIYSLDVTTSFVGPSSIVGSATGGAVIPAVVVGVAWIIPVGAFFIPFLTEYGCIDFVGVALEPLMRPLFKAPGKSAVDAVASFVGSTSMAVIITSRLYKSNVYTQKEASIISTCFSAVSVGYAVLVINTAGLGEHFLVVYFSSFALAFIVASIVSRLPPISKQKDMYFNGEIQTREDAFSEAKFEFKLSVLKKAVDRAAKRAYTSGNIIYKIKESLQGGILVIPKVITLLCSIGMIGMLLAEYTQFFVWLGYIFYPFIKILGVPNAIDIAPSLPAGITDMFVPVLIIKDRINEIHIGARYFVASVAMVQIVFLGETIVVMMTTGIPLKFKQLLIIFLQRTFVAMPFAALFMHIFFM